MTTSITREQFTQALRDHPEWREEIRGQILGEELMRLRVAFQAFVVKQETFNDEMRVFQAETLRRFENIDRRFDRMEGESSWLKNASTETMAASGAFAIWLAAGCQMSRFLDRNDVMAIARELTGANITPGDRASFARADLIIEAADSTGETVYLGASVMTPAAVAALMM